MEVFHQTHCVNALCEMLGSALLASFTSIIDNMANITQNITYIRMRHCIFLQSQVHIIIFYHASNTIYLTQTSHTCLLQAQVSTPSSVTQALPSTVLKCSETFTFSEHSNTVQFRDKFKQNTLVSFCWPFLPLKPCTYAVSFRTVKSSLPGVIFSVEQLQCNSSFHCSSSTMKMTFFQNLLSTLYYYTAPFVSIYT